MSDSDGAVSGNMKPRMEIRWPTKVDRKGRQIVLKDAAGLLEAFEESAREIEREISQDKDLGRMIEWAKKHPDAMRNSIISGILLGAALFIAGWILVAVWFLAGQSWEMLVGGIIVISTGAALMSTVKEYRQLRAIDRGHEAFNNEMDSIKTDMEKMAEEDKNDREERRKSRLLYSSYLRDRWAAKGRKEKCPSCGRGPEQYYGIDDPVLWAHYDERDTRIEDVPRCRCGAENDLAYCPIDAEANVLAVLGSGELDPCPGCGVSRILWTEIPEALENPEEPSEWEDYFQPAGGKLCKIFEVCAMCRKHVRMNAVRTGTDLSEIQCNWKDI